MEFISQDFKIFENITNWRQILQLEQVKCDGNVDFFLLSWRTLFKKKSEAEYKELKNIAALDGDNTFAQDFDIKQEYTIEVYPNPTPSPKEWAFRIAEKEDLSVVMGLFCNEQTRIRENLALEILQDLYKTMMKLGFLCGVRENPKLLSEIKDFLKKLENKEVFSAEILIAKGVQKTEGTKGEVRMHRKMESTAFVNYGANAIKKVCLDSINDGDLLFEYKKARRGRNGRSIKNEYFYAREPDSPKISFNTDLIESKDEGEFIKFYALKKGYLEENPSNYFTLVEERPKIISQNELQNAQNATNIESAKSTSAPQNNTNNEQISAQKPNLAQTSQQNTQNTQNTQTAPQTAQTSQSPSANTQAQKAHSASIGGRLAYDEELKEQDALSKLSGEQKKQELAKKDERDFIPADAPGANLNTSAGEAPISNVVNLRIHKGNIRTRVAHIDHCDGGVVEAQYAFVGVASNSIIKADYIFVHSLHENNKIYARFCCVIDKIIGVKNIIEHNYSYFPFVRFKYAEQHAVREVVATRLRSICAQLDETYNYLVANQGKIQSIRAFQKTSEKGINKAQEKLLISYAEKMKFYKQIYARYSMINNISYANFTRMEIFEDSPLALSLIIRQQVESNDSLLRVKICENGRENFIEHIIRPTRNSARKFYFLRDISGRLELNGNLSYESSEVEWVKRNKINKAPPSKAEQEAKQEQRAAQIEATKSDSKNSETIASAVMDAMKLIDDL